MPRRPRTRKSTDAYYKTRIVVSVCHQTGKTLFLPQVGHLLFFWRTLGKDDEAMCRLRKRISDAEWSDHCTESFTSFEGLYEHKEYAEEALDCYLDIKYDAKLEKSLRKAIRSPAGYIVIEHRR